MKTKVKNVLLAGLFIFLVASPVMTVATPQTTHAADANCENSFLGIPPWYRGLTEQDAAGDCSIISPNEVGGPSGFIWKIVLNVISIGLAITVWLALFFILYSGFLLITGGSNASQIEKARKGIFNAVIGLVISMGAIVITNLIFGVVGDATTSNQYGVPEIQEGELLISILNLVYYAVSVVAVIIIILAGIMYATSLGDASKIARSKNMILYAVIGILIVVAAFAITNFVIGAF
jgi:hypothetical protein